MLSFCCVQAQQKTPMLGRGTKNKDMIPLPRRPEIFRKDEMMENTFEGEISFLNFQNILTDSNQDQNLGP